MKDTKETSSKKRGLAIPAPASKQLEEEIPSRKEEIKKQSLKKFHPSQRRKSISSESSF